MTNHWNTVNDNPVPNAQEIIFTNGKEMCLGKFVQHENIYGDVYLECIPSGVSGYEFDIDVPYEDITHWCEAPNLPKQLR